MKRVYGDDAMGCRGNAGMPCSECTVVREPRGARVMCDDEPTVRWSRPDGLPAPVEVEVAPEYGDVIRTIGASFVWGVLIIATVALLWRAWGSL